MLEELTLIRNALVRLVAAFALTLPAFLFVPVPGLGESAVSLFVTSLRATLLPPGATLVVSNPLDPFFAQASIAAAFSTLLLIPLFMLEVWRFAAPALHVRERVVLAIGLLASLLLAAFGSLFAYFVLVPVMFGELYGFLPAGVEAYFSLREVVSIIAGFIAGCALLFLLPLGMALLSYAGLVPARVWREYARVAVLLVIVASAIITPDGSGVGMALLSVPVCALYAAGYAASAAAGRRHSLSNH